MSWKTTVRFILALYAYWVLIRFVQSFEQFKAPRELIVLAQLVVVGLGGTAVVQLLNRYVK